MSAPGYPFDVYNVPVYDKGTGGFWIGWFKYNINEVGIIMAITSIDISSFFFMFSPLNSL
jgi:hypothetical protein